jgi:hypothetical protein
MGRLTDAQKPLQNQSAINAGLVAGTIGMTQAALDAEASGYFLALEGTEAGAGWREVKETEAGAVWGKVRRAGRQPAFPANKTRRRINPRRRRRLIAPCAATI